MDTWEPASLAPPDLDLKCSADAGDSRASPNNCSQRVSFPGVIPDSLSTSHCLTQTYAIPSRSASVPEMIFSKIRSDSGASSSHICGVACGHWGGTSFLFPVETYLILTDFAHLLDLTQIFCHWQPLSITEFQPCKYCAHTRLHTARIIISRGAHALTGCVLVDLFGGDSAAFVLWRPKLSIRRSVAKLVWPEAR